MVETTTNPTSLEIYYCENCHGIIASTDIERLEFESELHCPFCDEDSLILLPKEDYQDNFDRELFPSPQDILLETFFRYADDSDQLLAVFSQVGLLSLLPDKMAIMPPLQDIHILISPSIIIKIELDGGDGYISTITSDEINDLTPLIPET